ncbi:hypothetical protein IG631_24293 [Alternaria alternata]|nr:hypothetical protein IG631_24293 [Alternaria alternata]
MHQQVTLYVNTPKPLTRHNLRYVSQASYCSLSYGASGAATSECFLHKSTFFDVAAGSRVYIAIAYALGITSSAVSVACSSQVIWNDSPRCRRWAFVSTLVATGAVGIASLFTSMLGCAVYMVFSGNLPESLLSVTIGRNFLAFTWSAFACLALVLLTILLSMRSRVA